MWPKPLDQSKSQSKPVYNSSCTFQTSIENTSKHFKEDVFIKSKERRLFQLFFIQSIKLNHNVAQLKTPDQGLGFMIQVELIQ